MGLKPETILRSLLRPLIIAWSILALCMMALLVWDCLVSSEISPVYRILKYRQNLKRPQWAAAERAASTIPSDAAVLVSTDDRTFFFALRYKLYPTWVVTDSGAEALRADSEANTIWRVDYHGGELDIREMGAD